MKSIITRESSIPTAIEQIDWIAFEHIQNKRKRTKSNFSLEALEFAQDKVLSNIKRQAYGQKLAEDLFRDGKKKAAQRYNPRSRVCQGTSEYLMSQHQYTEISPTLEDNFKIAISIVKDSFSQLSSKQAIALYIKFSGQDCEERIKYYLNVGIRQYRNILLGAREKLRNVNGFEKAFFLIMLHCPEEDLTSFLKGIVKSKLLQSKAA